MRSDQLDELMALRDRLIDEVSREADPKKWPKTDSAQGRGDRYWLQKNCLATLDLIDELNKLIVSAGCEPTDPMTAEEVAQAEKEAKKLLKKYGIHSSSACEDDDEDE